jgi:hypothetical protein
MESLILIRFVDIDRYNNSGRYHSSYLGLCYFNIYFFPSQLNKTLQYSNSPGTIEMVSIGVKEIFPLTKWVT